MASSDLGNLIFGEICRCCMISKPRMKPLFESNLHRMLSAVTGLQVVKNDGLPSQLCVPCVLQVRRSHLFKEQCEKTDSALRSYVVESKFQDSIDNEFSQLPNKTRVKQGQSDENTAGDNGEVAAENAVNALGNSFNCAKCPKTFELERKLKRHMRIHISQRSHACSECDMTFVEKSNLVKHMRKHTGELRNSIAKPHLCSECGKTFKYSTSLSRHKRFHANRNLFTCHICSKAYVEQQTLDIHMRTHTNERPFPCPMCDKSFAQKVNLERHERTHTGEKPFTCDVCGNSFTQKSYLVIHKRIHTQEKPYDCQHCSSCFISRNALQKHQRTPCSIKPYRCSYCKKAFRYKKCLRTHRRNHLLESPHVCRICDSRFLRAVKLFAHMKSRHPDIPFNNEDHEAIDSTINKRENIEESYRDKTIQNRSRTQELQAIESEYEDGVEEDEEVEEEEIEIENVDIFEEDDDDGQRMQSVEVVHVMFNGDGQSFEEQEDEIEIKEEPLLAIKIITAGDDDSDIEQ